MRVVELLFGCILTGMGLWGVVSGDIYILGGKANAGEGGWASFGEHPVIFLLAFCFYLFCGVALIRDGIGSKQGSNRD